MLQNIVGDVLGASALTGFVLCTVAKVAEKYIHEGDENVPGEGSI